MVGDLRHLESAFIKAERGVTRFGTKTDRQVQAIESRFGHLGRGIVGLNSNVLALSRSLGVGLAGALSVSALRGYADTWVRVTNQLKVAGLEGTALQTTLNGLFQIAQRNGTAIEPLVTLYGRLAQVQGELGASGADLQQFTEGVSLALRVAGTDAAGASGALLQLSQALGGGIVRAEEFNSVLEGVRPILDAVARGLKEAGGSVSTLRNLVLDGKLSSEAFFRAFLAGMGDLEAKAASTAQTSSQGFARIGNAMARLVGEIDRAGDVSKNFADILGSIAGGLDGAADSAAPFVRAVKELNDQFEFLRQLGPIALVRGIGQALKGELPSALLGPYEGGYGVNAGPDGGGPSQRLGPRRASTSNAQPVSLSDFTLPGEDDAAKSKARADAWKQETAAIQVRTEALRLEAQILGMSTFEVEKARAAHELLAAAQKAGLDVTPELREKIDGLATAYATATSDLEAMAVAQDRATEAMAEVGDIGRDVLGGFISDLRAGESAADALASALDRVLDRLLDIALDGLFSGGGVLGGFVSALTGGAGGGANINTPTGPGLLYHGGGKVGEAGHTSRSVAFPARTPRFHSGLTSGEFLGVLQKGEHVLTDRIMTRNANVISGLASAAAGGAGSGDLSIVINEAPGTKANVSQRRDGSLEVTIENMVNDAMGKSVNERRSGARALERGYGLKRTNGLKRRRSS